MRRFHCCFLLLHLWNQACCGFTTTSCSKETKRTRRSTTGLAVIDPSLLSIDPSSLPIDPTSLPIDPSSLTSSMLNGPVYMPAPDFYPDSAFDLDNMSVFCWGLFGVFSSEYYRLRREECAFEERVVENREQRLANDPTLIRRQVYKEESRTLSAYYGRFRPNNALEMELRNQRTTVLERDFSIEGSGRQFKISESEILELEKMKVKYDPYYDDPYTKEELPDDVPYKDMHGRHRDRCYKNGEIFYIDKETGLYFRQGAKPRMRPFWAHIWPLNEM